MHGSILSLMPKLWRQSWELLSKNDCDIFRQVCWWHHHIWRLPLDAAAPLLCAGITVYSPLRYFAIDKQGMQLGVVGLGDLDHMAVKFAKAFGAKVTLISTSPSKKRKPFNILKLTRLWSWDAGTLLVN